MSLDEPILMSRVAYPLGKGPARWELAPGHFCVSTCPVIAGKPARPDTPLTGISKWRPLP